MTFISNPNNNRRYIMKTSKEGQLKLTKNDYRVGNFVFSNYSETVQVQDISSTICVKLSKRTPVARLVEGALEERNDAFLGNFATMAYYVNGVVPDVEFWTAMNGVIQDCINRHPEIYGIKKDVDDAADANIIHEEKEAHEAIEKLRAEQEKEEN